MTATRSNTSDFHQSFSHLYIGWWSFWFYLRQAWLARLTAIAFGVLSFVEFFGPLTHLWHLTHPAFLYGVPVGLMITAGIMIYHHHRLQHRIKRLHRVIGSVVVLFDYQTERATAKPSGEMKRKQSVKEILKVIVFAMDDAPKKATEGKFSATVMRRIGPSGNFHIYAQDADSFSDATVLDGKRSAAAHILRESSGTLLYTPRTEYVHGVKIQAEHIDAHGGTFRRAKIVADSFQPCEEVRASIGCLLCVAISRQEDGGGYVLCLSSGSCDCMGDLEFHTIKIAAELVARCLAPHS